jgi:predicted esterase
MKQWVQGITGIAFLVLAAAPRSYGEVLIVQPNGERLIGETIKPVSNGFHEVMLYRGYTIRVPAAAVASVWKFDPSRTDDRAVFTNRLATLKPRDIAGGIELANWAMETGLVVQAQALLHRMWEQNPKHKELCARLDAPQAPKSLSDADRSRLEEQVKLYFASTTNREPVLRALRGTDAIPPGEAERWAAMALTEARRGPALRTGDTVFRTGNLSSPVHIELWRKPGTAPATNAAVTPERWPVLVALHGGGEGNGAWTSGGPALFSLFQRHFDRLLFVAPTVMEKRYAEWAGNPKEEILVNELLKAVKRTWPVDTDRVFMAGISMGGYGTWHIGGHEADTFAGLVSQIGGILIGFGRGETWGWGTIGNLMHTPIAFTHGGKDKQSPPWSDAESDRILTELAAVHPGCYRHKYLFYPSAGHDGMGGGEAVEFVAPSVRNPAPTKILWEPSRPYYRNFYWLRADRPRMFTRLEASVADNTFTVRTTGMPGGFGIWMDARLVDLSKPVTIIVDDQVVFRSIVRPTLSAILESVDDKIDPQMWYPARVDF